MVAGDERVEHRTNRAVEPHVVAFAEPAHDRQLGEQLREALAVGRSGGRFRVVLGELERVGQDEGVGAPGGGRRAVAGIDPREPDLVVAEREIAEQVGAIERRARDSLAERPQQFGDARHPQDVAREDLLQLPLREAALAQRRRDPRRAGGSFLHPPTRSRNLPWRSGVRPGWDRRTKS